jgi:NAD(P)-dependent dehydrogenase (short-subunit alcohol dehydrogenase family)
VLAINALAPFILNSRLRGLLEATPDRPAFVVNVSAMEGKFYRYKTPNHPHTNMAKAALNMMTRTCAEELASCGVLMNSVDTGWINDENPLEKAAATAAHNHFQTPLDEIDAAARILDPILSVVNGGEHVHGKFLKDYRPIEW